MVDPRFVPEGSEWCNDNKLKSCGVFANQTFTMGWWSHEKGLKTGDYASPEDSSSSLLNFRKSPSRQKEGQGTILGIDFDLDEEKSKPIRS
jgi:hypothetical protein